jgi:hypothetical protein
MKKYILLSILFLSACQQRYSDEVKFKLPEIPYATEEDS